MDKTEALVEHYHKSLDFVYEMWKARNITFLMLLGTIGASALLTLPVPESHSLLVDLIAKSLGISDNARITSLRTSFPFGILQSILLLAVFYLMVSLYHRSLFVLRYYRYLGAIEGEIRTSLDLQKDSTSFTREGRYYWDNRPRFLGTIKWFYIFILGSLLFALLCAKILDDIRQSPTIMTLIDLALAGSTTAVFIAYALAAVSLDRKS